MNTASVKDIKSELKNKTPQELTEIILLLARSKKENKELLTYKLFESWNEASYVLSIKAFIEKEFNEINTKTYYLVKKSIRKILKNVKKYIRYSKNKETEIELILYFCHRLKKFQPYYRRSTVLHNLLFREKNSLMKKVEKLHPDLKYDYEREIEKL